MMFLLAGALIVVGQVFAFYHGYRKGYEYARKLVGEDRLPPYERLHEEMP